LVRNNNYTPPPTPKQKSHSQSQSQDKSQSQSQNQSVVQEQQNARVKPVNGAGAAERPVTPGSGAAAKTPAAQNPAGA
jgi:hypothetical protein